MDQILEHKKPNTRSYGINTILVDGGDFVQGNPAGAEDKGTNMIRLMNVAGYDYAVPGNHDYDYGMDAPLVIPGKHKRNYRRNRQN